MAEKYTEAQVSEAMELKPALWVLKHQIKQESGIPIDFSKRKFLWDIYNDLSPKQVILKPPQIGMTVCNALKSFYVAKKLNRQIIYTLPTQGDVQDMVGSSFNRIIAQNPILKEWVKDHDTIEHKTVGDAGIFYRGTFTAKQAMMIPSGLNIHDEVDISDPQVITAYENRLQAQEDGGWRWYFSHPSLAGHGVDVYWQKSDKKEWYITCNGCKHEQTLTWPDSISVEEGTYICKQCRAGLPDSSRINGAWRNAKGDLWDGQVSGDYEFSGWHVSQLQLYNKSAKDIINSFNDPTKDKQFFYNYVLGLPFIGSDDKIEPLVVLRNCVDQVNSQEGRTIIGVDTGDDYISYVLMNKDGVFFYDTERGITASSNPYDILRKHLKRFPRSIVVIDQGGELMNTRQLQAEFPGRVFLCYYNKDRKTVEMVEWGENDEYWKVRVDRNRMITLMVEQLRDTGRVILNGTRDEWADFASQFGNLYREKIVTSDTRGKDNRELYGNEYVWKRNGPDHYCFVAGTKVATNKGQKNIEDIQVGDLVFTRDGYKPVYHAGKTKRSKVLTAYFSNGSSFTATPDHPIIHTQGKTRLDSTTRHAILYACREQKYASITESHTDGTQTLLAGQIGFTSHRVEPIEQKDTRGFISKYGLMPLETFLKAVRFIIKTKIRLITSYLTWCAKVNQSIKVTTKLVGLKTLIIENETETTSQGYSNSPMNGGVQKQVKRGIRHMLIRVSFWLLPKYLHVLSVVLRVLHGAIRAVSSVPQNVVIVGLHENIGKRDVINIAVSENPEYFAEGILVSNCHALLYAMVGLQRYGGEMAKILGDDVWAGTPKGRIVDAEPVQSVMLGHNVEL